MDDDSDPGWHAGGLENKDNVKAFRFLSGFCKREGQRSKGGLISSSQHLSFFPVLILVTHHQIWQKHPTIQNDQVLDFSPVFGILLGKIFAGWQNCQWPTCHSRPVSLPGKGIKNNHPIHFHQCQCHSITGFPVSWKIFRRPIQHQLLWRKHLQQGSHHNRRSLLWRVWVSRSSKCWKLHSHCWRTWTEQKER